MVIFRQFSVFDRFFDAKFRFFKKKFLDFWILTVWRSVKWASVENAVIWFHFLRLFSVQKKGPKNFPGFFREFETRGQKKGSFWGPGFRVFSCFFGFFSCFCVLRRCFPIVCLCMNMVYVFFSKYFILVKNSQLGDFFHKFALWIRSVEN